MRTIATALLALTLLATPLLAEEEEYDDCDANFVAFVGSNAYRFSPEHSGELGAVRLFSILSYNRAAHAGRYGVVAWKLEIERVEGGERVVTLSGRARIAKDGATVAEYYWDGRDDAGNLVPAGRYRYTFRGRFVEDRFAAKIDSPVEYDWIEVEPRDEALASYDEVVVDYSMTQERASDLRASTQALTSCEVQQNAPLEAGFAYNYYYGSTHSHSNWSDGGQPTTACTSGNSYGSGTYAPSDVFAYARDTAGLDFWVVNEHNHLIQDAIATNNPPVTESKVRQRYQDGLGAANSASTSSFVGLYGMEWGVSSNPDQGHVTLIETPTLLGWETCTSCNGPNPECTPGTNCYFDVFTPKRYGYLTMYARSVENPSPAGALGIFNHPGSGNFDSFAFDANADAAIQGIAVRSGLAFSTATDCASTNVGSTDYSVRWRQALDVGFHLAPAADHDSHCNNYGVALPTRTVYLLPNSSSPALSKSALLAAHKARRFYATEDPNLQLVFRTSDSAHVMGDIFDAAGGATLVAGVFDPSSEGVATIELWRGQIGAGAPTLPYQSWSGVSSVSFTESLSSGSYWYYVHVVQDDGHDAWSAPMWITFGPGGGGGGDTTAPTATLTAPSSGATITGPTTVTATASDNVGVTRVEFLLDGALASTDTTSPYAWSWDSTAAANGAHSLQARAYDAAANSGASAIISVSVDNGGTPPPTGNADVSGWKLVQANSAYEFLLPAGTLVPNDGYLLVARNATKSAFEAFWGITLGANVSFINSVDKMPVINGSETYQLQNASLVIVDGTTIAMASGAAQSIRRNDPCSAASLAASWTVGTTATANPGAGAGAGCGGGVKINEFSDATGTGNYIYEFIELHNDAAAAGDTEAPATSITAPANAATVSGTTSVTASATDNVGVTSVEFLLDGAVAATDTTSPYAWSWNTATASNGAHTLQSRASDAAGNVGSSTTVSVTVDNDTTAPATSITTPANGATVSGTASVTASATDDVGVTSVEFLLDGAVVATDASSPYAWSWNTTTASNGAHTLQSRASDAAGNVGSSTTISVTASNDTSAPATSITAPANGATVSGTTSVTASATDNVGVTSVEFLLDGAVVATDTTSPYAWSWNTPTAADGAHTLQARASDAAGNVGSSTAISVTVSNDAIAPATSVTAPANGATVSGATSVTASATDNVGVTSVEFLLDGAVVATDTTSPYAWSWTTTTAANGAHTLQSRASDAAGNVGTSASISVSVNNGVAGRSLDGWRLAQASSPLTYYFPAGTVLPSNGYVIVARNADKASFEAFWGRTLGPNVTFINSGDAMPQINGSETYTLYSASGSKVDGATVAMGSSGGQSLQRTKPCTGANKAGAWSRVASTSATPGSGAPAPCGKGAYIGEFSDALGTGNFIFEFVEIQSDN